MTTNGTSTIELRECLGAQWHATFYLGPPQAFKLGIDFLFE